MLQGNINISFKSGMSEIEEIPAILGMDIKDITNKVFNQTPAL